MFELRTRGDIDNLVAPEDFLHKVYCQALDFMLTDNSMLFEYIQFCYAAELEKMESYELMAHPYDLYDNPYPLARLEDSGGTTPTAEELLHSFRVLNIVVIDKRHKRFSLPPQREVW